MNTSTENSECSYNAQKQALCDKIEQLPLNPALNETLSSSQRYARKAMHRAWSNLI